MKKRIILAAFTLAIALAGAGSAFAQADVSSGTIRGIVTDQTKAVVVGAIVTARNMERGINRTDKTGSDGSYAIPALQPGTYEVRIEAQGFEAAVIPKLEVTVGSTSVYDVELQPGGVKAQVEITTEAPVIEPERTQQSNTISKLQIENFPNTGRDFTSYVYTVPGVSNSQAPRAQGGSRFTFDTSGFSIGGSNGRNNLVTVDGGENEYGSGQLRFAISPDSIQEFQVNRNSFSAEFGFTAGTAINVVTKSGTNDFHGSGYFFYRSQTTSARSPFDFNKEKPLDRQYFPGFTFGGPIIKNKLFFFTNYERNAIDTARFRTYTGSSLLQPGALQSTLLATLDASGDANVRRISANLRTALTTTAATYPTTLKLLNDNQGTFNGLARLNTWGTRIDYQPTQRDSINGRFTLSHNFTADPGTNNASAPSIATSLTYRDYSTVISWTHNFGNNLINQARGQFSPGNSAVTAPPDPAQTGLIISGLAGFGRFFGAPYIVHQRRLQFEDNLTWLKGSHTFKFGGSYRPVKYVFENDLWFAGEFQFLPGVYSVAFAVAPADRPAFCAAVGQSLATCLGVGPAGTALNGLQSFDVNMPTLYRQGFHNPTWEGKGHYFGGFAQDTWKVHPRLTLDIGGRIDYDGEPPPVPGNTYFSPRFGFAWQVTGDNKTVVRGGSGIFYSPIYLQIPAYTSVLNGSGIYINQVARTGIPAVGVYQTGVAQGKYPFGTLSEADINALGISTAAGAPGRVLFDLDRDYKNNYSIQANIGIQRQLANNLSLELAYQMYHGLHIQQPVPIDYCEAGTPGCPATAAQAAQLLTRDPRLGPLYRVCSTGDPLRPDTACPHVNDSTITQFTLYESRGSSIYHGLTVSLMKRFSEYYSFQINYTYSKAIDDQTDFNSAFAPPFPTRLNTERSLSSFDIRHNFVASAVFMTPFKGGDGANVASRIFSDVTVSPIIFIRSGIPFTLLTGTDINGDTRSANDRLFPIGRNTGLGPNYRSVNMRVSKSIHFKKDSAMRLDLSIDGSNLFNRTNYASVRDILPVTFNAATGQITSLSPDYFAATSTNLSGRKDRDFVSGQPLSFTSAFPARQLLWGIKFAF
ncbi:MAG TPA: carboxypeptidase regulatory-like domain-containing protein [Blastocatellia bacterium]|nr:carboxypeptidase regulatory-like domain-containing protein [Blastocatellia bacterium]